MSSTRQQRQGVAKRWALTFAAAIAAVTTALSGVFPANADTVDFQIWQDRKDAEGYPGDEVAVHFKTNAVASGGAFQAAQTFQLKDGFAFAASVGQPMTGAAGGCVLQSKVMAKCLATTPAKGSGTFRVLVPAGASEGVQIIGTGTIETPNQHVDGRPDNNSKEFEVVVFAPPAIDSPGAGASVKPAQVVFSGRAKENTNVTVIDSRGATVCSTTSDGSGAWSCTSGKALPEGLGQKFTPQVTSPISGKPVKGDPLTITVVDPANKPAAPGVDAPLEGGPVSGTGVPGNTVTVKNPSGDKVCSSDPMVGKDGRWTCSPKSALKVGDKVSATQTDPLKRTSDPTTRVVAFDPKKTPDAPVVKDPVEGGPVSGTGVPGNTVTVKNPSGDKVCSSDPMVGKDSGWSCPPKSALKVGDKVSATQTDQYKRVSAPATATTKADPNKKPAPPGLDALQEGGLVSGTGVPGNSVTVSGPDGMKCPPKPVDPNGKWSCVPTPVLEAKDVIGAKQIDPHQRVSTAATTIVGTDPRKKPVLSSPLGSDPKPALSGTGRPGDVVTVVDKAGDEVCHDEVDPDGRWSCVPGSPLSDGVHELTPIAKDKAGNPTKGDPVKATVSTTVDLGIAIADPEVDVVPGSHGTMRVTVTNNGVVPLTKPATVVIAPPADVLVGEAQPAECAAAADRRSATCTIAPEKGPMSATLARSLPRSLGVPRAGNEWTFNIPVTVANTVQPGATLTGGTATLSGPGIKTRAAKFAVKTGPAGASAQPTNTPSSPVGTQKPASPTRVVASKPAASLASTGVPAEPLAALGGLMVLVGVGLVVGRRSGRRADIR